ncbi:MAG: GMC oxidoreductase [Thermomicrobiaceae bacterium]
MISQSSYDYLVIGGGSAGAIVASRLAEDGASSVCLVEAGPSDESIPEILELQRWPELLHTDYDYGYRIEPQERGNSGIIHSRGRMLGGSGSHNICQAWRAPDHDMSAWEGAGATGWGPDGTRRYFDRVLERTGLEYTLPDNHAALAYIEAGKQLGYTERLMAANAEEEGVGWVALNAKSGMRQSSSVAYLHPLSEAPYNLTVLTDTRALRLIIDDAGNATGVETDTGTLLAPQEVILSCGAIDTPKLLMLSGIGPADHLRELGIEIRADLPVGKHLLDHPEAGIVYETNRPIHQPNTVFCDAVLLSNIADAGTNWPELMMWFFSGDFESFTVGSTVGTDTADKITPEGITAFTIAADILHSKAEGVVTLRSADPADPPIIDPRYFSDPEGWDEWILLQGIKLARQIAEQPALAEWIAREVTPGPHVQSDKELLEYARSTAYTAYHPAGTCRMGAADDSTVVVDPELRVRGVGRLRVADASIFPTLPGCNPNITCMMVGEKCADLVRGRG